VSPALTRWAPASVLALGATLTLGVDAQQRLPLRAPLAEVIPLTLAGFRGRDVAIPDDERRVAGVTTYLARAYTDSGADQGDQHGFTLYIGYYDRQTQGRTIHSPKNCLPGSGWAPLASGRATITTMAGSVTVNRYLLQKDNRRALVLYWYQGRGRVAFNEYRVKWDLLRDATLKHRSEEALVRVVVPVTSSADSAFDLAADVAQRVIPNLYRALPS
jgi:EpsI family protein